MDQQAIQTIARELWIKAAQQNVHGRPLETQLQAAINEASKFETEVVRFQIKFHLRKVYMLHATVAEYLESLEEQMTPADFENMDEEDIHAHIVEFMDDFLHDEIDTMIDAASIALSGIRWCGR